MSKLLLNKFLIWFYLGKKTLNLYNQKLEAARVFGDYLDNFINTRHEKFLQQQYKNVAGDIEDATYDAFYDKLEREYGSKMWYGAYISATTAISEIDSEMKSKTRYYTPYSHL